MLERPVRRGRVVGLLLGLAVIVPFVAWTATSFPVAAFDRAMIGDGVVGIALAAVALAGPGGTGLPEAVVRDGVTGLQNTAQGYMGGLVNQQVRAQQAAYIQNILLQAIQAHRTSGTGWQVVQDAVTYGNLPSEMQARLKQEFAAAAQPGLH